MTVAMFHIPHRAGRVALAAFCGLCFVAGCGGSDSKGPPLYTAKGSVRLDGKPIEGAVIVLHPVDKSSTIRPGGETNEDGEFELTSTKAKDGAPAGDYLVAVHWYEAPAAAAQGASPSGMGGEGESKSLQTDRLQGRYSLPEHSGLKCTIEEDENELPTFELRSDYGTPIAPGGQLPVAIEGA